ncbi:unnamed protein product [Symbiodinium sp. CCMP2592]|nr:unnamed protein product [Symbiodinium sp. CCMP2592]CAE7550806.1 unnamed protein product [Symbiodinium sp. CCMP2592]CAE7550824.1 unnamed protein product [Symbiodinium sp. CCMP2592]
MTSLTWLCGICALCVGVSADCLSSIRVVDQFLSEAEVGVLKSTRGDDLQHEGIRQRLNEALGGSVLVKGIASSRKTADVPKHQDQWSSKRVVEGKAGVVYLEPAADGGNLGSILFEDLSSKAVKEVEVVPGRLITWDNHLCLHGFRARHDGPRHTLDQQPFEEPAQLTDVADARDGCKPWCFKKGAFLIPGCRGCFKKYYGKYYGPSPPPTTTTGLKAAVKVAVPPTTTTVGLKAAISSDVDLRLAAIPDKTAAPAQLADVDAVDARDGCKPWCFKKGAFLIPGCRGCFKKYYGKHYGPSPPPTTTTGLKAAVKVAVPLTTTTVGLKAAISSDVEVNLAAIPDETAAPVPVQGGAHERRRAEHGQLAPHEVDAVHFMQMPDEL